MRIFEHFILGGLLSFILIVCLSELLEGSWFPMEGGALIVGIVLGGLILACTRAILDKLLDVLDILNSFDNKNHNSTDDDKFKSEN